MGFRLQHPEAERRETTGYGSDWQDVGSHQVINNPADRYEVRDAGPSPSRSQDATSLGTQDLHNAVDQLQRNPLQAWQMVREDLMHSLPTEAYSRFVEKCWVVAYEDGEFIIGAPDAFTVDWLEKQLRRNLKRSLGRYLGRHSIEIIFRVRSEAANDAAEIAKLPLFERPEAVQQDPKAEHAGGLPDVGRPYGAVDDVAAQADRLRTAREAATVDPGRGTLHAQPHRAMRLQSEFTFDTFVVGSHNRLAHAAATAVAEASNNNFSPLFIYGGVGLGKTHLLHAIGNTAQAGGRRVLYCTSEQFTNELIHSISEHSTDAFRGRYRRVEVLLIDDIQFIGGKERTQEEFFHTFNHLHESGSQIILTSDRPPKALATLEERLRSRFAGGLQTDIAPPDLETRVAILERKANRLGMQVDKRVLMAIAERFESNIRELEGALNQLSWQSQLAQIDLTYETALSIVDNLAPQRRPCSPPDVIRIVAQHYGVTPADLIGKSRRQPLARIRQITMYLLREENGLSLQQTGDELGGRDHSTVRHGAARIIAELQTDSALRTELGRLREKIYTPLL